MPQKEFSKSMKAKMYDFTYTPFMSSMVIAWIILNHKYILIYMSSIESFEKKLKLLDEYNFSLWGIPYMYNIILPITFGLFYTFVYPWISKKFYKFTLNRNKELKTIKKDIEDNTPITIEEAKSLKKENYDKTEKILVLEDKITAIRSDYNMKLTTIEDDTINKISNELNKKHQQKIKDIEKKLKQIHEEQYQALIDDCKDSYQSLSKEKKILDTQIKELKQTQEKQYAVLSEEYKVAYQSLNKEKKVLDTQIKELLIKNKTLEKDNQRLLKLIPKKSTEKESEEDQVLRFFYESDYKPIDFQTALDNIVKETKIPRIRVNNIIDKFKKEEYLSNSFTGNHLLITEKGNSLLVNKFHDNK